MTDALDSFRAETRDWLEANCPAEMRVPFRSEDDVCWGGRNWTFHSDAQRQWLEAMAGRGWTVPDWPKDYGGGGLSPAGAKILKEEKAKNGAPPPPAPTSPAFRPRPKTRATIGWSTARRSGPAMPTRPTGSSAWSALRASPSM